MYFINDKESSIRDIQYMLSVIYTDMVIIFNGIYEERTRNAVLKLQRESGIEDNGRVDYNTFTKMREAYEDATIKIKTARSTGALPFPLGIGFFSDVMSGINMMLGTVLEYYGEINRVRYNRLYSKSTADAVRILRVIYRLASGDEIEEQFLYMLKNDYDYIKSYSQNYRI